MMGSQERQQAKLNQLKEQKVKSLKFFKPTLAIPLAIVLAWLLSVRPAQALVGPLPPHSYGNDNFINRWILTGASGSIGFTIDGATKEPGEPLHAGNVGGHSIWYSWTAPASGVATFHITRSVAGVHFYPLLAVYTGNTVTSLSVIASSNGSSQDANVMFSASAGVAYEIAIDGKDGTTDYADVGLRTPPLFWQLGPIPTPTPMPVPQIDGFGTIAAPRGGRDAQFSIFDVENEQFSNSQFLEGEFGYLDKKSHIRLTNGKIQTVTINGNQGAFTGIGRIGGPRSKQMVQFTVTVTANEGAVPDTFSIVLDNGYSASGNLTSGSITIHTLDPDPESSPGD